MTLLTCVAQNARLGLMLSIEVPLQGRRYPVHIGAGLLDRPFAGWWSVGEMNAALIVSDDNVAPLYGERLRARLAELGVQARHCVLAAGETSKNIDALTQLWDAALAAGADRSMVIFALGGGVVGDIAGFAAATVLRGVRYVQVPTTLLAMVDSSVGGKTAINHPRGKNLVGAFKQPQLVIADIDTLQTLPARELSAGLAEAVKHAAALDMGLLEHLERDAAALMQVDPEALLKVIARCCELKAAVVAADEREAGPRRVLNFGHTVGHAIERVMGYGVLLHGEAVAIGMLVAMRVTELRHRTSAELRGRLRDLLAALQLPTSWPARLSASEVCDAVLHDKKLTGDSLAFIVCEQWGQARVERIDLQALRQLLMEAIDDF